MPIRGVDPSVFRDRYTNESTLDQFLSNPEVQYLREQSDNGEPKREHDLTSSVILLAQTAVRNSLRYPLTVDDVGADDKPDDPWTTGTTGMCTAFAVRTAALLETCGIDTRIAQCNGHYFNVVADSPDALDAPGALHMVHADQPLLSRFHLENIPAGFGPFRYVDTQEIVASPDKTVEVGMDVAVLDRSVTQYQPNRALVYPWLKAERPCPAATIMPTDVAEVAIRRYEDFSNTLRDTRKGLDDEIITQMVETTSGLREANPQRETRRRLNRDIKDLARVMGQLARTKRPGEAIHFGTAIIDNYAEAMPSTASMYLNRGDLLRTLNNKGVYSPRLAEQAAELYEAAADVSGSASQLVVDKINTSVGEAKRYSL